MTLECTAGPDRINDSDSSSALQRRTAHSRIRTKFAIIFTARRCFRRDASQVLTLSQYAITMLLVLEPTRLCPTINSSYFHASRPYAARLTADNHSHIIVRCGPDGSAAGTIRSPPRSEQEPGDRRTPLSPTPPESRTCND